MAERPGPHARILVEAVRVRNVVDQCDVVSRSLRPEDDRQDTPAQRTMAVGKGPPSEIGC
jgi:hypothetical protein